MLWPEARCTFLPSDCACIVVKNGVVSGPVFEMSFGMPASCISEPAFEWWLWLLTPASRKCRPWVAEMVASVVGWVPATHMRPNSQLPTSVGVGLLGTFGGVNQWMGSLYFKEKKMHLKIHLAFFDVSVI